MPSLEELGQKVKAKYPGAYDDIADGDLGKAIQSKFPGAYDDYGSATKVSGPAGLPRGDVSQRARKNLANILPQVGSDQQSQIVSEAMRKEAVRAAEVLPFALAAPFTGGSSIPVGMTIMGGAGVAGGLGREAINATQGGPSKAVGGLAASLGMDAAFGAASELGGRAVGAMIGKGVGTARAAVKQFVMRSAAKSDEGANLLEQAFTATRQSLYDEVGPRPVDLTEPLKKFYKALDAIPKGKGAFGQRLSSLGDRASEFSAAVADGTRAEAQAGKLSKAIDVAKTRQQALEAVRDRGTGITERGRAIITDLESQLNTVNDQISSHQPLDALIRERGNLNKLAWSDTSLNTEERQIFKGLANDLDGVIKRELAGSPRAAALYEQSNELNRVMHRRQVSVDMASGIISKWVSPPAASAAAGAVVGGAVGGKRGAVRGAEIGGGLGLMAAPAISQAFSVYAVKQVLANPEARALWIKAVEASMNGANSVANSNATKALTVAGIRGAANRFMEQSQNQPTGDQQ